MEIKFRPQNHLNLENKKDNKKDIQFKGAFDIGLRFLDTNQAWGANAVDLCSMVIPRTTVDLINRGPAAGTETARREASGTINHSLIGVYGSLAGLAFAMAMNKSFGIRADKIFADNETYDIIGKFYHDNYHNKNISDKLSATLNDVFKNVKTSSNGQEKSLNQFEIDNVVKTITGALGKAENKSYSVPKETKQYLVNYIMQATGSESAYKLKSFNKETTSNLSTFIDNVYGIAKSLKEKNVVDAFKETDFAKNNFIKSIKNVNKGRTIAGMAIGSLVGMSIQPLNIYLTKKKTGSDGFVGVEGREKDTSLGFKAWKAAAAAVFGGGIIADLARKEGGLLKNVQFKGMVPTINQFKLIYGVTIASRFLSARDKDELREAVVKDVLGFLNWLVLGNFVAKGVALGLDKNKSLLKNPNETAFLKKTLKTRDEVLIEGMKKLNLSSVTADGKALKFSEMLKKLPASKAGKSIRKQLTILNFAQIAGYLYSGLVLGVGIPKLNIYMTNKSEAKRQAKLAAQKSATQPESPAEIVNTDFLSQHTKNLLN